MECDFYVRHGPGFAGILIRVTAEQLTHSSSCTSMSCLTLSPLAFYICAAIETHIGFFDRAHVEDVNTERFERRSAETSMGD